jgi:hypothetical protein
MKIQAQYNRIIGSVLKVPKSATFSVSEEHDVAPVHCAELRTSVNVSDYK